MYPPHAHARHNPHQRARKHTDLLVQRHCRAHECARAPTHMHARLTSARSRISSAISARSQTYGSRASPRASRTWSSTSRATPTMRSETYCGSGGLGPILSLANGEPGRLLLAWVIVGVFVFSTAQRQGTDGKIRARGDGQAQRWGQGRVCQLPFSAMAWQAAWRDSWDAFIPRNSWLPLFILSCLCVSVVYAADFSLCRRGGGGGFRGEVFFLLFSHSTVHLSSVGVSPRVNSRACRFARAASSAADLVILHASAQAPIRTPPQPQNSRPGPFGCRRLRAWSIGCLPGTIYPLK